MDIDVRNKKNVLFVIIQMEMGGAERLVYNIITKLDRTKFNPSIAWFFGDKVLKEFEELGIGLYHVPKQKRFDFDTMKMLGKVIKENDIHVVNAHNFMSFVYSFYGCKIANQRKLIYTEHSGWEIEGLSWRWKKIGKYLLKFSDGAVGVSTAVAKRMQGIFKVKSSKTFAIENGINCEAFARRNEIEKLKDKLGIKQTDKIIGTVGNFKKVKNHIFLLKAFSELIKECKNTKLLLIGKLFPGDEEVAKELYDFVKEKGLAENIIFLGFRSDISNLLGIMDIFCLTSFKEGLPISIIEAMAAGLPVIGTNVEGIRDVIIPSRNGFLVELDDVIGMRDLLKRLLSDASLRQKMGEESKNMAISTYSMERCIGEYQNLFLSI